MDNGDVNRASTKVGANRRPEAKPVAASAKTRANIEGPKKDDEVNSMVAMRASDSESWRNFVNCLEADTMEEGGGPAAAPAPRQEPSPQASSILSSSHDPTRTTEQSEEHDEGDTTHQRSRPRHGSIVLLLQKASARLLEVPVSQPDDVAVEPSAQSLLQRSRGRLATKRPGGKGDVESGPAQIEATKTASPASFSPSNCSGKADTVEEVGAPAAAPAPRKEPSPQVRHHRIGKTSILRPEQNIQRHSSNTSGKVPGFHRPNSNPLDTISETKQLEAQERLYASDHVDLCFQEREPSAAYRALGSGKKNEFHSYSKTTPRESFDWIVKESFNNPTPSIPGGSKKEPFFQSSARPDEDAIMRALIAKQLRSNFLFLSLNHAQIVELAQNFEAVEYAPGTLVMEQGSAGEHTIGSSVEQIFMYYYFLVKGECVVVKDGKEVHGKFGTIAQGTLFGEGAMLYNTRVRTATIVATKPPPGSKTVVLYRLKHDIFRKRIGDEEISRLRQRMHDIQVVIDMLSGVDTNLNKGTIVRPYRPSFLWLLKQWKGTVLQYVWPSVLTMMVMTALFCFIMGLVCGEMSLDVEYSLFEDLEKIYSGWKSTAGLVTFVSTFFLGEAFRYWRSFYGTARQLQGCLANISLILVTYATRNQSDGKLTDGAVTALDDVARIQTLTHQLFWCTVVERFRCLLSPEGYSYLLSKKLITQGEYASLIELGENSLGGHFAGITWLASRVVIADKRGEINLASGATMHAFCNIITKLRGKMGTISDLHAGRMPLAYVHFVHLLISIYLLFTPIALLPTYGYWSVPYVGVLTLFYHGLFKLSLCLLDPMDNDKYHETSSNQTAGFDVGVLIREAQTGGDRFKGCAVALPQY